MYSPNRAPAVLRAHVQAMLENITSQLQVTQSTMF